MVGEIRMNDERGRVGEVVKGPGEIAKETVREIYGIQKTTKPNHTRIYLNKCNITSF